MFLVSLLGGFPLSSLRLFVRPLRGREVNGNSSAKDAGRIGREWSPDDGASSASDASRIDKSVVRLQTCNVSNISILSLFAK